jgi:hypothetical protein
MACGDLCRAAAIACDAQPGGAGRSTAPPHDWDWEKLKTKLKRDPFVLARGVLLPRFIGRDKLAKCCRAKCSPQRYLAYARIGGESRSRMNDERYP